MADSRTPISHSQRATLRRYYQTATPKPTQSELRAWFQSRFGYNISQSIVSRSLSNSFAYLDVSNASDSEFRTRNCQWPWLETLLTDWLQEVEAGSCKVTNKTIGQKAKKLWVQSDESQGLATPKFSHGWVIKFRRRYEMRLQSLLKQDHTILTPNHSSVGSSASPSYGSSASIANQALISFWPQREASTATSLANNASLDTETNALATPTISSDHFIHLVQHNSYRGLMSNKDLIFASSLILKASPLTAPIKQFATKICGGLTVIHPLDGLPIPDSLYPTELQINCAHTGIINMFPFPKFRDNLIEKGVNFVPEEMCRDLFGDIFPDYVTPTPDAHECTLQMRDVLAALPSLEENDSGTDDSEDQDDYTAGRKCMINWGDPWNVESWEVTPGFVKRWSWALEGCDDLIQASNKWRASRNERLITTMARYAEAHLNPNGPGDARPTAIQIIKDEGVQGKLAGKVVVVTGTSAGIGIEIARAMSLTGAKLLLTARDLKKAKTALDGILAPGQVELVKMDNNSLSSVRAAAEEILQKSNNQVNILINNAGIMALPKLSLTEDGFEKQFGVDHLSHFLLFQLLKPALLANASPEFSSRVVSVSSSAHHVASINESGNYNFEKTEYNDWVAYGQAKTANIYMANEIERRYGSQGLHATSVHPGIAASTGLMQHVDPAVVAEMSKDEGLYKKMKTAEQGAATTVWAAIGKEWENKGGEYLAECAKTTRGNDNHEIAGVGYAGHAYDPEAEARLWKDSLVMVGLTDDQ
ncbi:uncharacterized protein Bfra_003400 [Botrytis fragariae]|uniref:HTH CENPB-type domain-containing protein n=1 Tax=Botrytis fragariae TaxID=1964551 RepID=A0A8H6AWL5_9HELO|nr:uncharacterized protein Bfra_003400 [Botrytis fragariae]KAF5874947.1 hypothetical protein Bfra_003400 [Botrytis fragariae]